MGHHRVFKRSLEASLDKHFPKGECKERGAALLLFAEAVSLHEKANPKKIRSNSYNRKRAYWVGYGDGLRRGTYYAIGVAIALSALSLWL